MIRNFDCLLMCLVLPFPLLGQYSTASDSVKPGIQFEKGLDWVSIQKQAKKENKYIFVDCYTTWCGPCKKMEKEVYSLQSVGEAVNKRFISLKMQMDSSKADNDRIKALYPDAHFFSTHFRLQGYPTLLFFNPDGKLLTRTLGARTAEEFIKLTNDVLDPRKDYYLQLDKYSHGMRDMDEIQFLARTALELLDDTAKSEEIANFYVTNLDKRALFINKNIEFIRQFTRSSNDLGFHLFYEYADSINSVMDDKDYAQQAVYSVIYKEVVIPEFAAAIDRHSGPNWIAITSKIQERYNDYYTQRVVAGARMAWARKRKVWPEYASYLIKYVQMYSSKSDHIIPIRGEDFVWNARAWEVFTYSKNRSELMTALEWSSRAVRMDPNAYYLDTYANILYKLGYGDLAIKWENLAVKQDPENKPVQENLDKMKAKQVTWLLQ